MNPFASHEGSFGNGGFSSYTAESCLGSATDPRGKTTAHGYDAEGLVSTLTAADGGVTSYDYDGVGNLTSVTDPLGRTTSWGLTLLIASRWACSALGLRLRNVAL